MAPPLPTPGGRLVRKSRTPGVEPGGRTGDFLSRGGRACVGGMEVRIGGKSRRLARFESPRRDLLPRPRLARVGLVVRALSLLGSARLARSLSPSVAQLSSRPGREKKASAGSKTGPEDGKSTARGVLGLKRGRLEFVKYASRREIYTAVSNLDARNARTRGPRVEIACCGACGATFPPNLAIFPSVLERLESVLFPALSELLSPSRNLSGNGVALYYDWGAQKRNNAVR